MGFKFNPFTGNLDKVMSDSDIREIALSAIKDMKTSNIGALGNKLYAYDPVEDKWVELGQQLVFDENGEIVIGTENE
jgi:hypothetical protein